MVFHIILLILVPFRTVVKFLSFAAQEIRFFADGVNQGSHGVKEKFPTVFSELLGYESIMAFEFFWC